jgi:membrane associated rhomboid family serine protease
MTQHETGAAPEAVPVCYRHADRETYIRCQRCERPICPDCMNPAAVGFQCPDCVREGARTTRQARTPYGGTRRAGGPVVTWTLMGLNLLVFLAVSSTGSGGSRVLTTLGLLPRGGYFADGSASGGAYLARGVSEGAFWQLLTSMFTHAQVWHIVFNMMALYLLGPQLEMVLGRLRFAVLYVLSGLVGSATVYWLAPESSLTIGASGAVFGLMGALLVLALKVGGNVQGLLTLLALNGVITVLGAQYISWQGHLGGLVGGLLLGWVMVYAPRERRGVTQAAGTTLVVVLLLAAVIVRTVMLRG